MKKIMYMQYPDNGIHKIRVYRFCISNNDMYFISYLDELEHIETYTTLSYIDRILMNNPYNISLETLSSNCKELDIETLPQYIPCANLYSKKTTSKPKQEEWIHTHHIMLYFHDIQNNKYYLDREGLTIARNYNIKIEGKTSILSNKNCYSIKETELNELKNKTKDIYSWIKKGIIIGKPKNINQELNKMLELSKEENIDEYIIKRTI